MIETIFDKIIRGEEKSWVIWQDDNYLAFLTPYPNTPGVTVVIPKNNLGDYIFNLEDEKYNNFMMTVKRVSNILEKAFDIPRVALVFEGTEIAYVHAKLYPLHGQLALEVNIKSNEIYFNEKYNGYITTIDGQRMSNEELDAIQQKIIDSQK